MWLCGFDMLTWFCFLELDGRCSDDVGELMDGLDVSSDGNWIQLGFSGGYRHGCCLALKLS